MRCFDHAAHLTLTASKKWRLLNQDGSIWVSIDDAEMPYLRVLMDEVCGRAQFVAANVWQNSITTPSGVVHHPPEGRCWSTIESEFIKLRNEGRIWFGKDGSSQPNLIRYLTEVEAVLSRCEWGKDDYSLKVENLPKAPPKAGQMDLFEEGGGA